MQVWLWNLDSGAVTRKLVPAGLQGRPQDRRAVEAVAFMHGDFRYLQLIGMLDAHLLLVGVI